MKTLVPLSFIFLLFSSYTRVNRSPLRIYEIQVEAKLDRHSSRHKVMVEARNMTEARKTAQRIVQHKLVTKVITGKEIKKP